MSVDKKGRFVKIKQTKGGYGFVFDRDAPPSQDEMLENAAIELAKANARIHDLEESQAEAVSFELDREPVALAALRAIVQRQDESRKSGKHPDAEVDHLEADEILLTLVSDEVKRFYREIGRWYS